MSKSVTMGILIQKYKTKCKFGSNAKFASSILDNISNCHISGLSLNVQCLSVNPSLSNLASLPLDQRQSYFASTDDFDIDNNCDFEHAHDEQIDDACDTTIVSSSSSIQQIINPHLGIKFEINLQQMLSSHFGVLSYNIVSLKRTYNNLIKHIPIK